MSPEERHLLAGLFERTKSAATAPRDREAEDFIADQVKGQPAAPYLLAQTVIVQEQALEGANARIQELEGLVKALESRGAGGLLGGFLGGGRRTQASPPSFSQPGGPWGPQPGYAPPPPQYPGYAPEPAGGGFLRGALGTAAGVAGGVLLADSIRNLFAHGGMGGMSNLGIASGYTPASETTIINNYYGDEAGGSDGSGHPAHTHDAGYETGGYDDDGYSSDAGYDDSGFGGGDGGFDV
jgi:hypothetical protein